MNDTIYCQGCGAPLQTIDERKIGYIPKITDRDDLMCRRCFKLRHYNVVESVPIHSDDYKNMVAEIRKTNSLIIHLIDVFDVDSTLIESLPRFVGKNPIILVANKIDLLPKSTNLNRLKNWLRSVSKKAGLNVKEVYLTSAKKGHSLDELAKDMEQMRKEKDIYVTGVTNVGKSTFLNAFIQRSTGIKEAITTSYFPGTTLGFITIPLDDNSALIDTPGIMNEHQLAHYVSNQDLKKVIPNKEIKPRNYQLNENQSLFVGGLARLDFIKGNRQTFVCYYANDIPLHRTKVDQADALYDRQLGELLSPPTAETIKELPKLVEHSFRIKEPYTDIVISGLGWFTIINGDVTVKIHSPKGIHVTLRKSILAK